MTKSMKYIALLVIGVLVIILSYQAYWLVGLYHTMQTKMHSDIQEVIRVSDYDEMMYRTEALHQDKNGPHGRMDVSVSANSNHTSVKSGSVLKNKKRHIAKNSSETDLPVKDFATLLKNPTAVMAFGLYMQQGIHAALDQLKQVDSRHFDRLLTHRLDSLGIHSPHLTLYLSHYRQDGNKSKVYTDTLAAYGRKNITYTDTFRIDINQATGTEYQVFITDTNRAVLYQMKGILIASLVILLILILAFWYLIHTILKQKTLDEMKTDFTNNITHELKTPIAVAYAANDALLNFNVASDREKAKKYLTISQEQLRRLSGLVEQILSMSMERRKTMKLSTEDVNIRSVVTPLISQQKLKADKPTDITTDIPEELSIKTDRMHFANIISNLIDNAIKYSCDKADISIAACTENHQVVIRVTDRGIGIAADKQKYIFDKFYRVPHGNQHEAKGYGLGLYYVKSMMDKLHGSITVKSEPGKGTTFILKFND